MSEKHPAVGAFDQLLANHPAPRPSWLGLRLAATVTPRIGLSVAVLRMPFAAFNPAWLTGGPAVGRALFSPLGLEIWRAIDGCARAAAKAELPARDLAFVMLMDEAVVAAKATYLEALRKVA